MCSYGSWKSPSSPYMKYTWEFIEVYCKGVLKKAGSSENADITADEFKSWVVAKWSIAPERNMNQYSSGVWLGDTRHIYAAHTIPTRSDKIFCHDHLSSWRKITTDEARMSPKKKLQSRIG